jgi:adenylate cyclase
LTLTVNQRVKLKITRQFVGAGIFLGIAYIFFEHGLTDIYHYINGIVVGVILGLILAFLELSVFARGAKKLKFIWLLALRTLLYFILIVVIIFNVVLFVSYIGRLHLGYLEAIRHAEFQEYLLGGRFMRAVVATLIFAFSINFVRMISLKMGQGMLLSYITGTYYAPVHQVRIIMFLNLVNSRKIVGKLGPLAYHNFLNDLFYDLTIPVVTNSGIIYEYIEDLIVISWSMDKGMRGASCIRAYFDVQETINLNKEKYLDRYGLIPHMRAGLHTGSVVRAEIGEVKTQIVFHGDTMNTTARILSKGKELEIGLLASDQLIRMIGLPRIYKKRLVGEISLRGKQEPIKLFEIIDNTGLVD